MFFKIGKTSDAKQLQIVFLKNVANLTVHDHGKTFKVIHNELERRGYYSRYTGADVCEYGISQHRTRSCIVVFRDKQACDNFRFFEKAPLEKRIADVIDTTVKADDNAPRLSGSARLPQKLYFPGHRPEALAIQTSRQCGVRIRYKRNHKIYYGIKYIMDSLEIFNKLIGDKIKPLIIKYDPYQDVFETHPYRHVLNADFEERFVDTIFDSIIFYAYEKNEIEKEYNKGHFDNLRKASHVAYENRVPKTEKETDGLLGELTLDSFIKLFFPNIEMLYSRVKYIERRPHKEENVQRKGQEIKGYDCMVFSIENGQKYFWAGQVKTGSWQYCLNNIKNDINKSIIKYYFADAIVILCDIMRAANGSSPELDKIINDINEIIYDCNNNRGEQTTKILTYFRKENIKIRIPCLLMANESNYADRAELLKIIKTKVDNTFKDFNIENDAGLNMEILLLVFPLRDLQKVRELFLKERKA